MNIDERQNFTELLHRYFEFRKWFEDLKEKYDNLQEQYTDLQNSFEESQDELASANAVIMKYKEAHSHLVSIVSELKEELSQTRIRLDEVEAHNHLVSMVIELEEELRQTRIRLDEVEEDRDNWKTVAIRKANELNDIEMRNLMREKPAQECCTHCNKSDCSECPICPF